MFHGLVTQNLCFRASGENVTIPIMDMMPFHTLVGMDMLWFPDWMPMYALFYLA